MLDAVRAAVGTAALDKLKETPLGQLASAVAVEAAPLATRAFDALGPAFDSIVATAADVIVEHDLNEDIGGWKLAVMTAFLNNKSTHLPKGDAAEWLRKLEDGELTLPQARAKLA
eukprot:COSAG05_NODE_16480_length_345_cov_0.707317_1_plen_114_part_11